MDMSGLSRKYAEAFMQHYDWYKKDFTWMEKLNQFTHFLRAHRRSFVYEPHQRYALALNNFELTDFDTIMILLEKHHRMFLLPDILYEVVHLYKVYYGIEDCEVTTAYALTPAQKNIFENTLEKKVGKKLLYSYTIDNSLIAGIRARGENFIYEDTIKQRLKTIEYASKSELLK